ncbi:MAG: hypothetical protein HC936_11715 [Leptolyngbyaceae cyanobacterium SU_3_3]|nr:hypothetical protein [Leptolyngbyaceae cyanobacterium SU_3_3]
MVPRGNAQIVSLGVRDFNAITVSDLQSLTYGSAAIDGSVIQWKKRFPTQTPPIFRHPDPRVQELSPKINPAVLKVRPDNLRNIRVNNFRPIQPIEIRPRDPIIRNEDNFDPTDNRRNLLVNGSVFAVKTNSGNFAKVQVLSYGYNLQVQWVTYHPKVEPQFREVVRVLDVVSDRSPFVFSARIAPSYFLAALLELQLRWSQFLPR